MARYEDFQVVLDIAHRMQVDKTTDQIEGTCVPKAITLTPRELKQAVRRGDIF